MKRLQLLAAMLLTVTGATTALADQPAGISHEATLAIYLAPHETENPIQLRDKYYKYYWINRGEIVSAAALETFRPMFREVSACEGNNSADVIAWVKPQLFFNPQMNVYYAKLKVNFYRTDGKGVGALKAEAQRNGFLDNSAHQHIQAAYADAFKQIVAQFNRDTALQDAIRQSMAADVTPAPCAIVGIMPNP